jgi:uncharacterized membrane protein
MALSNNVPVGFGHQYAPSGYIDAWVEVTSPKVSAEAIERLKARFSG